MKIDDFNQILLTRLPEGNYETLGGFSHRAGGKNSSSREKIEFEGTIFIIENADQKSIREVIVIFPRELNGPRVLTQ